MSVRNSYDEIVVERADGTILRGQMWARNGAVTVTSSDGRQKTTWAGYSPRAIAKLMLIELEEARLGNPMFRRRNFNGHSSHSDCSGIPATACAREINVEERLHRQHWIERDVAMRANIAADIDGQIPPHSAQQLEFFTVIPLPPCGRGLGPCEALVEGDQLCCVLCGCVAPPPRISDHK